MVRLRSLHSRADLVPQNNPMIPEPRPRDPEDPPPEEDAPDEQAPPPLPFPEGHPLSRLFQKPQVPAEYAHMYEEREGFANYYFNQMHRDRVSAGIERLGEFPAGPWKLTGKTVAGEAFELQLSDTALALTQSGRPYFQRVGEPFTADPPGTGGLLAAAHHQRLMLIAPEDRFTEFYYLGSEPLDGNGEQVDVLIATRGSSTSRWYFRPQDAEPLGFDTEIEPDADACEIRFVEWRDVEGRRIPARFAVHLAGESAAVYEIQQAEFGSPQE
jgi:hypothetical protein